MWFFGKDKDKKKDAPAKAAASVPAKPLTSKEAKTQALMAQMRTLRAEIGEENLEKIVNKLKLDALKKQIRDDIDNDPKKRDRLLDELRFHVRDDDKPGR
jgi:hypothetical protein